MDRDTGRPESTREETERRAGQAEKNPGGAGISNRESAGEEAAERQRLPPVDEASPEPQDAAGRVGEEPLEDTRDRQTSLKGGSHSTAQKTAETRYPDRAMPATSKVDGAFGKEPQDLEP
jgi:hypothetical protein